MTDAAKSTGGARSSRWRERRRNGLMPLTVNVSLEHRRALERMGLIPPGHDRDREAITWAVERFLDTAPAVQAIGDALYRGAAEPVGGTVLPGIGEDNAANA
ncbi:MAG: hypothetical protein ACRYHQ_22830 [Janthinobacterium lividum]